MVLLIYYKFIFFFFFQFNFLLLRTYIDDTVMILMFVPKRFTPSSPSRTNDLVKHLSYGGFVFGILCNEKVQ